MGQVVAGNPQVVFCTTSVLYSNTTFSFNAQLSAVANTYYAVALYVTPPENILMDMGTGWVYMGPNGPITKSAFLQQVGWFGGGSSRMKIKKMHSK